MTEQEIRETVLRTLRNVAPEIDPATLAPGVPLREQVDIDSVDYLRVLVELNEKVGVDIPEADYARIATIDQLVAYLAGRTGTARAGPPAG